MRCKLCCRYFFKIHFIAALTEHHFQNIPKAQFRLKLLIFFSRHKYYPFVYFTAKVGFLNHEGTPLTAGTVCLRVHLCKKRSAALPWAATETEEERQENPSSSKAGGGAYASRFEKIFNGCPASFVSFQKVRRASLLSGERTVLNHGKHVQAGEGFLKMKEIKNQLVPQIVTQRCLFSEG